jgi:hypothetical protein
MLENRTMTTSSMLPQRSTQLLGLVVGALGLLAFSSGCVGAQEEPEPESIGATSQPLGTLLSFLNIYTNRIEMGLQHAAYTGFFNLRYGIGPTSYTTATSYTGLFNLDGLYAGASYSLYARECDGSAFRGWSSTCGAWTDAYTAYVPALGSTWGYAPTYAADGLAVAYGAGSYLVGGVTTALPICSAYVDGSQFVGYWNAGSCYYGVGGVAYNTAAAHVLLTVPDNAAWQPFTYGVLTHGALRAGFYGGNPLYACRAQYQGAYVPGYIDGNACAINWAGQFYRVPAAAAQVLTW